MGSAHSLKVGVPAQLLRALLLAAALAGAGCATLDSAPSAPDRAWFDAQLSAGQYAQASTALAQWRAQKPDDVQLDDFSHRLDAATAQFHAAAISDAQQLREQQHWADADQRLLVALQQLPNDAVLKAEYASFDAQREKQREQAQHEFDIGYARELPLLLQRARAVFELKPQDLNTAAQLKTLQESANSIAVRLAQSARRSQREGDIAAAAQSMRLAAPLSGDAAQEQQAQQLEQELAKTAPPLQQKMQHPPPVALTDALKAVDVALAANQLEIARASLKILQAKYPANAQIQLRAQRYETLRQTFVHDAIEKGRRYYSTGDLANAIDTWESAYLFDPGNQDLRDRIDRAQRFRAKVEALQQ